MPVLSPLWILILGIAIVVGMIVVLRLNAFFAMVTSAIVVSLLAPGEVVEKISRVAEAFGTTVGKIGIPIAMAVVIGKCMLDSGAADRLAQACLRLFGQERGGISLAASGFVLSIPVFFDTVFYLLFPIAKSMHQRTQRNYLKYLLAIGAGGTATHTLVPPTPGPLAVADSLGVDIGLMILMGILVGIPVTLVSLIYAQWIDRRLLLSNAPEQGPLGHDHAAPETPQPGLWAASLPITLPILLISTNTIVSRADLDSQNVLVQTVAILGNPLLAMMLAATAALWVFRRQTRANSATISQLLETSLMDAGPIILITAAGGAFGGMLKVANVAEAIQTLASGDNTPVTGIALLWLAFGITSMLKLAQGSTTVAMITASGMLAAMTENMSLAYDKVYLAAAIGCGSMVGVWMNDSGFWIFARMGGLTPREAMKSWSPMLASAGLGGMLFTVLMATLLPLV
ncbi:GntP family permease [Bythopirellula polymerisocia]|uniref:Gnt-II system L-idonate transporter n=1 Tax=Bythopirellula polymerisocia TaxID=2528003 RepID=A0A5C6CM42_9BACT|nr:SLC13 family permease [Bythopirellula polymerisocia]TWU24627.1 Gnt-II system L-idonate transporter [Bythopirellula polymerisocia]